MVLSKLPLTVPGATISRACSSGLQSIAVAATQIASGCADVMVAGGVESITARERGNPGELSQNPALLERKPDIYMAMGNTAEVVARRYQLSREYQDEFALQSQQRIARAQEQGLFDDEIAPMTVNWAKTDKATGETSEVQGTVDRDECNRPTTTYEGLAKLPPAFEEDGTVTAGNASQLSDGASMTLVMSEERAKQLGLEPWAYFRGFTVAGCEPDEMGIGPVFAVPKLLKAAGVAKDDIDLWELNEAFASQCLYCRDALEIDPEKYNVNGGSISIGHPFGMTGSRLTGHIIRELRRRKQKLGVVTMVHRRRHGRGRSVRGDQLDGRPPSHLAPSPPAAGGDGAARGAEAPCADGARPPGDDLNLFVRGASPLGKRALTHRCAGASIARPFAGSGPFPGAEASPSRRDGRRRLWRHAAVESHPGRVRAGEYAKLLGTLVGTLVGALVGASGRGAGEPPGWTVCSRTGWRAC